MSKRDLFIVLIKIFGLYCLVTTLFSGLPSSLIFFLGTMNLADIIFVIITFIIIIGLFYLLVYKADKVSDFLKLEKGFDEPRIDFSGLKNIDIIKFVVLIIGGFLFIENIPTFFTRTIFAFKSAVPQGFSDNGDIIKYDNIEDYIQWASSALNLIVGYFLIKYYKQISNFLNKKVMEK
ncbi:hypothetical protein KRX57_06250 [Weeksellaceae bacterium TAE3-ERU29]|nr:hypothetical protein [Weeksellaceae bacterium TAE3-ERU29]